MCPNYTIFEKLNQISHMKKGLKTAKTALFRGATKNIFHKNDVKSSEYN